MSGRCGLTDLAHPSFSIVIPTYQRRELVREAVRALCRLDYAGRVELIVVVDGSTDSTAAALSEIDCPFPFRIIEQRNAGAASARNRGAAEAGGDIILFLDDDMIAEPDVVQQHSLTHRAGADAVLGQIPIDPASPAGFMADGVAAWADTLLSGAPLTGLDVFTGQLSVRRSVFDELGGFDETFTSESVLGNEDADFGVRLLPRFELRYNPAAISRQRFIVSPGESMRRATRHAAGDVRFAVKHPQLSRQLFECRGAFRPLTRFVLRPLSRIPLLPKLLSELTIRLAEMGLKTRFRSSRTLARSFGAARSVLYWSAVSGCGGIPRSIDCPVSQRYCTAMTGAAARTNHRDPKAGKTRSVLRKLLHRLRRLRRRGAMQAGQIASLAPLSTAFGLDRGTPIDRFYIERFLASHAADIRGTVVEVVDAGYSQRFGGDKILTQHVLDLVADNQRATIVGDLVDPAVLPAATFDCIILTQTLHIVYDMPAAVRSLRRALVPGGVALVTVPGITAVRPGKNHGWYWSMTGDALHRLLGECFEPEKVTVSTFGNLFAATAFLHGAAVEEVDRSKLDRADAAYPVIVAARAVA